MALCAKACRICDFCPAPVVRRSQERTLVGCVPVYKDDSERREELPVDLRRISDHGKPRVLHVTRRHTLHIRRRHPPHRTDESSKVFPPAAE